MRPVVRTQHRGHMFHRRRDLVVGERARLARRAYGKQLSPVDSARGTYRVRGRELLAYRPGEEPGSGGEDVRHRRARLAGRGLREVANVAFVDGETGSCPSVGSTYFSSFDATLRIRSSSFETP